MSLDHLILEKAKGDQRFQASQQRHYLGTLGERVVLTASIVDTHNQALLNQFSTILDELVQSYQTLHVKVSSQVNSKEAMAYLSLAQKLQLPATIVEDSQADSPFGLVIHSDQAVAITQTDCLERYPELFIKQPSKPDKLPFLETVVYEITLKRVLAAKETN